MQATPTPIRLPRSLSFALFLSGLLWLYAASFAAQRSAQGIATQLNLPLFQPLLRGCFLLLLLTLGFTALEWVAVRSAGIRATNALPVRATARREWTLGVVLGWLLLLLVAAAMMMVGALRPHFFFAPSEWGAALVAVITLAVLALANEVAFRGYLFRRLIDAVGPSTAAILLSGLYALAATANPNATRFTLPATFALGLIYSLAYLRTHALWLGWGLHFAWAASMAVLLGLPLTGLGHYASVVQTETVGPAWFTGAAYGPEASLLTVLMVCALIPLLMRVTRDFAWNYTHAPIVAAGYPMEAKPPAAHVAMENSMTAAQAPALVQISTTTASGGSTLKEIDEHLRARLDPTQTE